MTTRQRAEEWAQHCWELVEAGDAKSLAEENLPRHVAMLLQRMQATKASARHLEGLALRREEEVSRLMQALVVALDATLQQS